MFKHKSPVKKLSLAIALTLITGAASATTTTIYDTYKYLFDDEGELIGNSSGTETLNTGDWAAGYFFVDAQDCPAGCDLTEVNLLISSPLYSTSNGSDLSGLTLEVYSSQPDPAAGSSLPVPGNSLFELTSPVSVVLNGTFGTRVDFTAVAQDPNASPLLQADTAYWLKLTNESLPDQLGWYFNGVQSNEYWASSQFGNGEGSPYIFDVTGEARAVSHVPVPGAVWLMGSALIGLLTAKRRKID